MSNTRTINQVIQALSRVRSEHGHYIEFEHDPGKPGGILYVVLDEKLPSGQHKAEPIARFTDSTWLEWILNAPSDMEIVLDMYLQERRSGEELAHENERLREEVERLREQVGPQNLRGDPQVGD